EVGDRELELEVAGVDDDIDGVEAGIAQHLADRDGVPLWIRQFWHVGVVGIAYDKRQSLLFPLRPSTIDGANHRKDGDPHQHRYGGKAVAHNSYSAWLSIPLPFAQPHQKRFAPNMM